MASPQTHGLASVGLLGLLAFFKQITMIDFLSMVIFGILIDFDHFLSKSYIKDFISRRLKKGEGNLSDMKIIETVKEWGHKWPGIIIALAFGYLAYGTATNLGFYLPLIFLAAHVLIDYFQDTPRRSFWYPMKKGFLPPPARTYPCKPPQEFMITSGLWMLVSLILLGIILK